MIIQVNNATLDEVREKLANKATRAEAIEMLKAMKEVREMHEWRSGGLPSCCVNLDNYCCMFRQEADTLGEAIEKLESGNDREADLILDKLHEQFAIQPGMSPEMIKRFEKEYYR